MTNESTVKHVEQSMIFEKIPNFECERNVLLHGHFWSLQYFDQHAAEIERFFGFSEKSNLSKKAQEFIDSINLDDATQSISVYIQGADTNIDCRLDENYYTAAFDKLQTENESQLFFVVFSNDVRAAHEIMMKTKTNFSIVPQDFTESESLHMMIHFAKKGMVMANSCFSWWAAFLAWQKSDRKTPIYMPKQWFGKYSPQEHSLHVSEWNTI